MKKILCGLLIIASGLTMACSNSDVEQMQKLIDAKDKKIEELEREIADLKGEFLDKSKIEDDKNTDKNNEKDIYQYKAGEYMVVQDDKFGSYEFTVNSVKYCHDGQYTTGFEGYLINYEYHNIDWKNGEVDWGYTKATDCISIDINSLNVVDSNGYKLQSGYAGTVDFNYEPKYNNDLLCGIDNRVNNTDAVIKESDAVYLKISISGRESSGYFQIPITDYYTGEQLQ